MRVGWSFLLVLSLLFVGPGAAFAEAPASIVIVKLRTPRNVRDARFDPYYDLGRNACFGITGCHRSNIMNPARVLENLLGKRVAFVQQGFDSQTGESQQRLILLTPPLKPKHFEFVGEGEQQVAVLKWDGTKDRAFRFLYAPILVSNDGQGVAPLVALVRESRRETLVGAFGSLFRTRVQPLEGEIAKAILERWTESVRAAKKYPERFAVHYAQTMHPPPQSIDADRLASFQGYRQKVLEAGCSEMIEKSIHQ